MKGNYERQSRLADCKKWMDCFNELEGNPDAILAYITYRARDVILLGCSGLSISQVAAQVPPPMGISVELWNSTGGGKYSISPTRVTAIEKQAHLILRKLIDKKWWAIQQLNQKKALRDFVCGEA